jgi:hypothetical protein
VKLLHGFSPEENTNGNKLGVMQKQIHFWAQGYASIQRMKIARSG